MNKLFIIYSKILKMINKFSKEYKISLSTEFLKYKMFSIKIIY
jgi:hypothetical protein